MKWPWSRKETHLEWWSRKIRKLLKQSARRFEHHYEDADAFVGFNYINRCSLLGKRFEEAPSIMFNVSVAAFGSEDDPHSDGFQEFEPHPECPGCGRRDC